jgi:hypothetical protein
LAQLPRRCPTCGQDTIVGHGRRRKQAHDERHDWIWVRRGRCPACEKTFQILPTGSPPSSHYSYCCRQQASELNCQTSSWEQSAPHCKDPSRLPDPSTLRRWACRRLMSLWALGEDRTRSHSLSNLIRRTYHPCLGLRSDFYTTRSPDSIQRIGEFDTKDLWRQPPPADATLFEAFVQQWLERLAQQPTQDLPRNVRETLWEYVVPAITNGDVRAAHPR